MNYPKHIIEIADYIFNNPEKKVSDVISYYFGKFRKTERTIETYIAKAKKYNEERIKRIEKVKQDTENAEIKKNTKSSIADRNRKLEILTLIMEGNSARKLGNEVLLPTDSERIKAIMELNKMQGDYAAIEQDISITGSISIDKWIKKNTE